MQTASARDLEAPAAPDGGTAVRGWTLLAMGLAALDLSRHLFRNWVSFDEGMLGLAGRLVREGRWPHQDFSDPYSGGLALLNAATQHLLGDDLAALRIPFGIAAILWVALLAACFRRFYGPAVAAGLALAAFLWGPPLHAAAMPSWYLAFLGTGVIWCLFRWQETDEARYWFLAGLLCGVMLFLKINALFVLAGAGCVLLTDDRVRAGIGGSIIVMAGVVAAGLTIGSGWPAPNAATLLLPLAAMAAAAWWHERRARGDGPGDLTRILVPTGWLAAGVAVIVVPWVAAYAIHGGLAPLIEGLLVLPFRRPLAAHLLPLPFRPIDTLTVLALPVLLLVRWPRPWAGWVAALVVALALFAVDAARVHPVEVVRGVWRTVRGWAVLVPLLVAWARTRRDDPQMRPTMIAGWLAVWIALLQYPFAGPNYLAYTGGPLFMAGAAFARRFTVPPIGVAVVAALTCWTVGIDHGASLANLGYTHAAPPPRQAPLDVPHGGGLLVGAWDAAIMRSVVDQLDRWQARTIVAGPDAPHIYYFSDRPFPDREFYEFLAPEWSAAVFAARIEAHRPDAVVLNWWAPFSRVPIDSVVSRLSTRPVADTIIGPFRLLRLRAVPPDPGTRR